MEGIISFYLYSKKLREVSKINNKDIVSHLIKNISNDIIYVSDETVYTKNLIKYEKKINKKIIRDIFPPVIEDYNIVGQFDEKIYIKDIVKTNRLFKIEVDVKGEGKSNIEVKLKDDILYGIMRGSGGQNATSTTFDLLAIQMLYDAVDIRGDGIAVQKSKYESLLESADKRKWHSHELFAAPFNRLMGTYSSLFPWVNAEKNLGARGHADDFLKNLMIEKEKFNGVLLVVNPPFEMETMTAILEKLLDVIEEVHPIEIFITVPVWDIESQKTLWNNNWKALAKKLKWKSKTGKGNDDRIFFETFYGKTKEKLLNIYKNLLDYQTPGKFDDVIKRIKNSKWLSYMKSEIAERYTYTIYNGTSINGKDTTGVSDTHEIFLKRE